MRTTAVTGIFSRVLAGALFGALLVAAPAGAATSGAGLYLTGAGDGHGIGMSQYGAAGYALHGASYQEILRDYYAQTTLGHVSPSRRVTVLLRGRGAAVFSGATTITGSPRPLTATATYAVEPALGGRLRVRLGRHSVGVFPAPLQVNGPGPLTLVGLGAYRGAFVFRPATGGDGVMTVNSVGLDDYVRGVVSAEMPSDWPQQALDAQAVAARTYAITSRPISADFQLWDSTRSQMYEGVKAETAASDAAVAATSGQVVEYNGTPVTTYFFASSGGETESVQNVFQIAPAAWLVARRDPYDDSLNNPYHRWKLSFSLQTARAKLGRLVDGSLEGIRILQRGVSPRIVKAQVVGTRGSVTVTGEQLRKLLGMPSTWVKFTTVTAHGVQTSTTPAATTTPTGTGTTPTGTTTTPSGGGGLVEVRRVAALAQAAPILALIDRIAHIFGFGAAQQPHYAVSGTIFPVAPGDRVTVQSQHGASWKRVATGRVGPGGHYSVPVVRPGSYRVLYGGTVGPTITVG